MDKKKIGIAVGYAAVIVVIAICAVMFGGKKDDAAEPAATPEPTAAPTPVVTAVPQPVVTAAPQPAQQEPSSDDGGEVPDWFAPNDTGVTGEEYEQGLAELDGIEWE